MARKKISEIASLTSSSILFGSLNRSSGDVFIPVVDGNDTKKITIDELFGAFNIFSTNNLVFSGSAASTGSIGKLIVHSPNRESAINRMERALEETIIEGPKTTIPFHQAIMKNNQFRKGDFDTSFLETFNYNKED